MNKVSYYKKPSNLSLEDWQHSLRVQFGQENEFRVSNVGSQVFFSDFHVFNPSTLNSYKVSIRDFQNKNNFCSCLDFKTNRLGICKHISAVYQELKSTSGFEEIENDNFHYAYTSVYLDYQEGQFVKIRIGKYKSEAFKELTQKYFDNNHTLLATSFPIFEQFLSEAKRIDESFVCYEDALAFVIATRENIRRRLLFFDLFSKKNKTFSFDNCLKVKLYPFQVEGVKFAAKAGRSLIADEMGLGKTLQALAVAEIYKKHLGINKVLIVCPTSLKYQWKSEIEKFTESQVHVIEGTAADRKKQYTFTDSFYVISSYNSVANDIENLSSTSGFDLVILDEAQRIKNWKTKVARSVKKIETPFALVLTGTPIENKLEELYSIMQFIDVFKLGPLYAFLDRYQVKNVDTGKVIAYKNLNEISGIMSDVLIRRTKKEVMSQLPERLDKNLFVPMTKTQKDLHDEFYGLVSRLVSKWRSSGFLNEIDRQRLILSLSQMRMVCDSTFILDQHSRNDTKIEELMSILEEYFENGGEKVVIFSQWERMTRLVSQELSNRQIGFEYLNGSVPSEKRKVLLDNFKDKKESNVFLSTDAGGVGLNLQSASMIINLDIPWNPAVLEQRIGRVYRIGQKNKVTVINLISTGTIEHKMLDILKFKSSMAIGVLDGGEDTIFLNNDQFKEFMESLETVTEQKTVEIETHDEPETEEIANEVENVKKQMELIVGDDDVPILEIPEKKPNIDLINQGVSFFENLIKTLQSPDATQELIKSLTERDKDGNVFLKIPIQNQAILTNALKVLSGFLGNVSKNE
ncbi:DEAD/DEAH box helicase [Lacihabitans sp. LS3-19]|uniref:DEAD/DEAH box helicase n=1 Tax=Lacihabitans sp. LS3-19 TaxID=2487335 RepID=UPI0020CB8B4C|nr:DEAD/DEAH box helicase [Lacihabitans sp. LS3-19]MCP9768690.1 DEAD/DEAH box helicase [Lacihabitans sp. LS3-19]